MHEEELQEKIAQLAEAFARLELAYNSRSVLDMETKTLYAPEPWLKYFLQAVIPPDVKLVGLPESDLAPMTEELRGLARELGLPEYEGKSLPACMRPNAKRCRCPNCGSWLDYENMVEWKEKSKSNPFTLKPQAPEGLLVCGECGWGRH